MGSKGPFGGQNSVAILKNHGDMEPAAQAAESTPSVWFALEHKRLDLWFNGNATCLQR